MTKFKVGDRVMHADAKPASRNIPAYVNMRGTVTNVAPDGAIKVQWDVDDPNRPDPLWRNPRSVVLAE